MPATCSSACRHRACTPTATRLARRVLPEATWARADAGNGSRTIGDALLEPHRSYLDDVRILRRALREAGGDIGALAHITGGGWEGNVPRTLPDGLGVEVETGSWPVPPIFSLIQSRGDIADEEMVRTFNLGIGMTAVVPAEVADAALAALPEACRIGRVVEVPGGRGARPVRVSRSMRLGVLVSGRGSNLEAVLDAGLEVVLVVSNRPGVRALEVAAAHGVPALRPAPRRLRAMRPRAMPPSARR